MVAFGERALCYQVGLLLLVVSTGLMATGMAVPWWAQTHSKSSHTVTRHSGLWLGCSTAPEEECSPIDAPNWFKAVQALQCLSLIAMSAGCVYGIFTNCCLDHATFSRVVEISAGTGGLLGMVSCMLYVAKTSHVLRQSNDISYSWAFGVDVAACVFVTFVAAVIALANSRQGYEEGARLFIEDGNDRWSESRSRSRPRRRQERRGMQMEVRGRSPARTTRLGGTSSEVMVLQNNGGTETHPYPPVAANNVADSHSIPLSALSQACAACTGSPQCHPWKQGVIANPGMVPPCQGATYGSHGHSCPSQGFASSSRDDCPPAGCPAACVSATASTNGSCIPLRLEAMSHAQPSALLTCQSSTWPEQNHHNLPDSLPPPYSASCLSSGDGMPGNPQSSAGSVHDGWKGIGEVDGKDDRASTSTAEYPRAVATAPPLHAEYGDHANYPVAQFFAGSQTVCVGSEAARQH